MRRKALTGWSALGLLVVLGATTAQAANNPAGWIQTNGWNYLITLKQSGSCGGGGAANMLRNWVAPHDLKSEDPKAGDVWDIDFGGAAGATSSEQGDLEFDDDFNNMSWLSNSYLNDAGFPGFNNGDLVDFNVLAQKYTSDVCPAVGTCPGGNMDDNDVLGIATTYVNNTSGALKPVTFCTSSDDSVQVLLNNLVVTNVSSCRGSAADCSERRAASLPPGISRITVLVFEGGSGFNFRFAIEDGGVKVTDGNAAAHGLEFIGSGEGDESAVGQQQFGMERSRINVDPSACTGDETADILLLGNLIGADGDMITVVEDLPTNQGANISITGVTNGGVVSDIPAPAVGPLTA
ncbi:MAG TPA: hypothetical protein VFD71_20985, partial [Planctomycetota bacterium]|nr:hypothetical protein [Planctomycetota bacterium]